MFGWTLFSKTKTDDMPKFLVVGLGNIGSEYRNTRHNIGFDVVDHIAQEKEVSFETLRYGQLAQTTHRGKKLLLLKPTTYMNLSGKAVRHWMQKEKIAPAHLLIITDDIHLDFGTLRFRAKGSAGGHNGLKNIEELLGNQQYPRLRFGVGSPGRKNQVDYVLGQWSPREQEQMPERIARAAEGCLHFLSGGLASTMNTYNNS